MAVVVLPSRPRVAPPLIVDPGAIRRCGGQLLAASAQVDDLGGFVAGAARVGDWHGRASTAYHEAVAPTGRQADAMSLALRGLAQRVDAHADAMTDLEEGRTFLADRRQHLLGLIGGLEVEANGMLMPTEVTALQDECRRVQGLVDSWEADLTAWSAAVSTEERGMDDAFTRVLDLASVERRFGGVADPADVALATKPPGGSSPVEVAAWWDGLTRQQQRAVIAAAPGSIGNLDGLRGSRDDEAHLTVVGHSYGSTTAGHGAADHGLDVADLVFVGSPGVGGDTNRASDTGVDPDHVWAGANSRDPVTYLANHGWFHGELFAGTGMGDDPAEDDFGARRFQAEDVTRPDHVPTIDQHSRYFDHDTESLYNIGSIIDGNYDAVLGA